MRKVAHRTKQIRWSRSSALTCCVLISASLGAFAGLAMVFCIDLPQLHDLDRYRPPADTVLYDNNGHPFAAFALQRRTIAQYDDFPKVLYDAVLSIEDRNFEKHPGFEPHRMIAAAFRDLQQRGNVQGASTLTMQLARNLFLTPERTFGRKFRELVLAIQIERHFTKSQIFTLYANQIYLGHGVYGFEAGAEYYFSKPAKNLSLEEAALLAALPKAPNTYSPIKNPKRALQRRNLVIDAMLAERRISFSEATAARTTPIRLHIQSDTDSIAPNFVEDVRQYLETRYGTAQVHEGALKVYTTLDIGLQKAANKALLDGLAAYERRHGWRAARKKSDNARIVGSPLSDCNPQLEAGTYCHAEVMSVSSSSAHLRLGLSTAVIETSDIAWTNHTLPQLLRAGDLAYVKIIALGPNHKARVRLEQDSAVQGALLAIDSSNGEIKAMVGGRDFSRSKFNRATQALRQVGSSFKPYVYTAAIDQGATPDDIVLDAPETFLTASGAYIPHNYDGKFEGPITLTHALADSRNLPALKLTQALGIKTVIEYVHRFGIEERIPAYLPVALGAADLTLLDQTSAFTTFPNDGLRPLPHSIVKVTDSDGRVLEQNYTTVRDVISPNTARTMTSMLREAVLHGTAKAAIRLKHQVAGKTGTTNNFTDAWFIGFSPSLTCGVWVGFDEKISLGDKETGATTALPIWMDFMETALSREKPRRDFLLPSNSVNRTLARQATGYAIPGRVRSNRNLTGNALFSLLQPASKTNHLPALTPQGQH